MKRPSWAPDETGVDRPSAARVYDYFLGGAHDFAADRQLAEAIAAMTPDVGDTMCANRAFLRCVEPGLVHLPLWRPGSPLDVDGRPERFGALAGVGRVVR